MEFTYFELLKESYQLLRKNLSLLWAYLLVVYLGNFIVQIGNVFLQVSIWIGGAFFSASEGSAALIIPGIIVILLGFFIMPCFILAYTVVLVSGRSYMIFVFLFVLWGIFLALASIVILALINLGLLVTVHNFLIIYTGSMVGLIISLYYSLTLFLAYNKDYRQKTKDYRL